VARKDAQIGRLDLNPELGVSTALGAFTKTLNNQTPKLGVSTLAL